MDIGENNPNHQLADTKNNSVKAEYSIDSSNIDSIVNREEELIKRFPYKDGTTYIQSIDRFNSIGIDSTDSIDDREDSGVDSVNVAATKPPQPTAPPILFLNQIDIYTEVKQTTDMEQGLSFSIVILLCAFAIVLHNGPLFLGVFTIGSLYLLLRGKRKGWRWNR